MYNHIGHFAAAGETFCKALFLGSVTRRFPDLKFAFLECGVGWACTLYSDLLGHWEKRNVRALIDHIRFGRGLGSSERAIRSPIIDLQQTKKRRLKGRP